MSMGIKEQNIARNEQNIHQNITPMILIITENSVYFSVFKWKRNIYQNTFKLSSYRTEDFLNCCSSSHTQFVQNWKTLCEDIHKKKRTRAKVFGGILNGRIILTQTRKAKIDGLSILKTDWVKPIHSYFNPFPSKRHSNCVPK